MSIELLKCILLVVTGINAACVIINAYRIANVRRLTAKVNSDWVKLQELHREAHEAMRVLELRDIEVRTYAEILQERGQFFS